MSLALIVVFAGAASGQPKGGTPVAANDAGVPAPSTKEESAPALRLIQLERRVQALKERAWRAKARVGILKEDALGGGVGAQATLSHQSKMGSSFRLTKLVYAVDGTQVFARTDDSAENLYKTKAFDILNGPIAPGSHTISIVAVYRGHGYGVFKYLDKYTFNAQGSHTFTVDEGKTVRIECTGYEQGGPNTPMEKRASVKCSTANVQGK